LIEAAVAAAGIPVAETVAVGDASRDLAAARAIGVRSLLVRTGKGRATEARLDDDSVVVYDDLLSAAEAIVNAAGGRDLGMSIRATFDEHAAVMAEAAATLGGVIEQVVDRVVSCLRADHTILVCGNGGSAADAQHLAAELVCRFARERGALRALALTTDTSALTAIANDLGYEQVFARQVEALARPGDLLVAISTSGSSANVVAAARQARAAGCTVIALTGRAGGELAACADLVVAAPSATVARIQEVHGLVIHILAAAAEEAVGGEGRR
jgi:D-sedoheptulose 7-phosphate isomerase